MKKRKKKKSLMDDVLKASRKGSREAEIEQHTRPISYNRVFVSKKVYDRKKIKADDNRQPYSSYIFSAIFSIYLQRIYW